jgi:peptide/nickel transport system substrate-binding protein
MRSPSRRRLRFAGCALAAVTLLTAGCGGSEAASTAAEIPHTFVQLDAAVPTTLSPETITLAAIPNFASWYATLVRLKGTEPGGASFAAVDEAEPYLATSWTTDAAGNVTFTLADTTSSFGNKLTADDVKWTFERAAAADPTSALLFQQGRIRTDEPVTVVSPTEARINVDGPSSLTVGVISVTSFPILDSTEVRKHATPEDPWATAWLKDNSGQFGAYNVSSFTPGEQITLTANPNWAPAPYFSSVVMRAVPDANTRLQAVLAGDAQKTSGLEWSQFATATTSDAVDAFTVISGGQYTLGLVQNVPAFANRTFREGLNLAIDREALRATALGGNGKVGAYPLNSAMAGMPFGLTAAAYDPERAKQLIAESGFAGFSFAVATSPVTGSFGNQLLALVQAQLKAVGITMEIETVPSAEDYNSRLLENRVQSYLASNPQSLPDSGYIIGQMLTSDYGVSRYLAIPNPELRERAKALVAMGPGAARDTELASIIDTYGAQTNIVPLVEVPVQVVTQAGITGYEGYSTALTFFDNLTVSAS